MIKIAIIQKADLKIFLKLSKIKTQQSTNQYRKTIQICMYFNSQYNQSMSPSKFP